MVSISIYKVGLNRSFVLANIGHLNFRPWSY